MTIWRRRQEFGIIPALTNLSDEELQRHVREMRAELPEIGESIVCGRLRSMGFRVQRQRVREAIQVTDSLHTALRWQGQLTSQRPYSVPGPNSLWHIGEYRSEPPQRHLKSSM